MASDEFERRLDLDLPRGRDVTTRKTHEQSALSARWLSPEEMRPTEENGNVWETKGGLLLGKREGRDIGWRDDRHVMTIAGSRAGKGASLIVPNLFLYEGSALVIDPKGELARETSAKRGDGAGGIKEPLGQKVHVLDPFAKSGCERSAFNPLSELNLNDPDVVDDAAMFADALIEHGDGGDRYWTESAQAVLRALILLVLRFDEDECNLLSVRALLSLTHPAITNFSFSRKVEDKNNPEAVLIELLINERDHNPQGDICAAVGHQLKTMGDKERGSVLSTARSQTQWLDSPAMKAVLVGNDFKLGDLKREKMTVYLCLPAMRLGTHARWLRLMILLSLTVMERVEMPVKVPAVPPVLFCLDEFAVLGHLDTVEKAAGLMAGYGVKLWVVLQNIGQIKQHYKNSWETFIANCGVMTVFGITDDETLRYISGLLGKVSVVDKTASGASASELVRGAAGSQDTRRVDPLLAEDELRMVFGRKQKRVLIFNVEDKPAIAERFVYFNDPRFDGMYVKR